MGEKTSEQSSVFAALECAGFSVRGVVKQPTRRGRQRYARKQKRTRKKRGAILHVMKRSANVTQLSGVLQSRTTGSGLFSREFLGALKAAKGTADKPGRGQRKQQEHIRLTAALQSALNKASSSPVLLDAPARAKKQTKHTSVKSVKAPYPSSRTENEAEIRSAMRELFSSDSSPVTPVEPQRGFFQRLLNLRIEFTHLPFGRREQRNRRSEMLQALKEQHRGIL
jgi:hypothetical protein